MSLMLMMNQETSKMLTRFRRVERVLTHENEPVETQRSRIFDFFSDLLMSVKEASKQPAASQARVIIKLIQ